METPIIETAVVCTPTSDVSPSTQENEQVTPAAPRKKTGRPRQHANATERKRAQRARDKAELDALGVPAKPPTKKIHGSDASRARAYRIKKAVSEHSQYRPKIDPPGPTGTQSDWNRYLESVGLGMNQGLNDSVPTNYKGDLEELQQIDTAHQIETQAEGYFARRTRSNDSSNDDD